MLIKCGGEAGGNGDGPWRVNHRGEGDETSVYLSCTLCTQLNNMPYCIRVVEL